MHCSFCKGSLGELVDGTLPVEQQAVLLAHIAECDECAALLEELRNVDALLLFPRRIEPLSTFTQRIMSDVGAIAPPRVARTSTVGVMATYLVFAWALIGAWWTLAGGSARAAFASVGTTLDGYGVGLTSLSTATTQLFGPETSGVSAVMGAIIAIDAVAAIVLAIAYAATRPRLVKDLARISENL